MTSTVTKLTRRDSHPEPPRLPPIARDPLDDAREVLAAFGAKQGGDSDACYADLAEDLAVAKDRSPCWSGHDAASSPYGNGFQSSKPACTSTSWRPCRGTPRLTARANSAASRSTPPACST